MLMVRQENNSILYSGTQDLINVVWGGGGGASQPGTAPPRESATLHILIVHAQGDKKCFYIVYRIAKLLQNRDQLKETKFPVSLHFHSSFSPFLAPAGHSLTLP